MTITCKGWTYRDRWNTIPSTAKLSSNEERSSIHVVILTTANAPKLYNFAVMQQQSHRKPMSLLVFMASVGKNLIGPVIFFEKYSYHGSNSFQQYKNAF